MLFRSPGPHRMMAPGGWPDHGAAPAAGGDDDDAHDRASWAKYKEVGELEVKIAEKESELVSVHEAMTTLEDGGGKGQGKLETEAGALENEIEALVRSMNRLRTEADEELVREMVADETRETERGVGRW